MLKLYTINCPACKVLESKLDEKGLEYQKHESEDATRALGFSEAPLLEVNGQILQFSEAIQYINNL